MTQARPTILIADDDPLTRLFVKNALEPAGMVVIEATGGKDALAKFEALPSDLVILDIMMPEVDGYLTCSRIRSLPRGKRIPILILTGLDDVNSIAQAYQHGATDFIINPGQQFHAFVQGHQDSILTFSTRNLDLDQVKGSSSLP